MHISLHLIYGAFIAIFAGLYIRQCVRSIRLAKAGMRAVETANKFEKDNELLRNQSLAYINSCKLIDIKRNGRINYFTFARGSDIFVIETMGLLADDVANWTAQAGLNNHQPSEKI
jgi:hypothetical protein